MNALVVIHIAAGGAALLSGAAALAIRKGGPRHRSIGNVFVAAMLVMASTGAYLAAFKPERISVVGGILTCYLVATAWATGRHRDGKAGRFELVGLVAALAIAAAFVMFGRQAAGMPTGKLDGFGASAYFLFGGIAALAAAFDLTFILRGRLSGVQRLGRHLWRMCFALFFAAASFFLGQQDEFPHSVRGSLLLFVPPLATLALMVFWLGRLRYVKAFKRGARATESLFERIVFSDRSGGA